MGRNDQAWAVFRCSLLSPLLTGEIPEAEREAYFHGLSPEERLLPNGQRKRISVRTLRRWWKRLRDEGVDGTFRRRRRDRGRARKKQQSLLDRAVELKKEQPRRSDVVINRILKQEFGRGVPRSTLYRHLRRQGATRRKLGISQQKIRCRWTREQPGVLWVGDFEHGPPVVHQGSAVQTRLSAWIEIDDTETPQPESPSVIAYMSRLYNESNGYQSIPCRIPCPVCDSNRPFGPDLNVGIRRRMPIRANIALHNERHGTQSGNVYCSSFLNPPAMLVRSVQTFQLRVRRTRRRW